jgi:nucleotide-binding universal stress UspA family protein
MTKEFPASSRTVIVAATDGSAASDDVIRTSAIFAARAAGPELHLLHVVEPMTDPGNRSTLLVTLPELLEVGRKILVQASEEAKQLFAGRIVTHLSIGAPWREILQLCANVNADVVIVGSHQRNGIERWLLGSVSEQIVRKASCQVLVARAKNYAEAAVPEIEPACAECLATQHASAGTKLWCTQHDHKREHPQSRLHYERPPRFAVGSMLLRPES